MDTKQIQWFPGHMSKTLREFEEIKTDMYIVILDARAPRSSFVDSFINIINNKKVLIIINKTDLVNKQDLQPYINEYKNKYDNVITSSLNKNKDTKKQVLSILKNTKFKSLLPKIVILGVPNVGKSTLLNILSEGKKAKVENRPGVTKSNSWYQVEKKYWLLDTPGVLTPKFISYEQGVNLALIGSIKLDILPIEEISKELVKILMSKDIISDNDYLDNLIDNTKNDELTIYKKLIKDYQDNKYGKVILDTHRGDN